MKDVAEIAKVSKGMVSMVINNYKGISWETRQKVLAVVKSLDYRVNEKARALARCRKK
jgi:DNA-binding LacI/PurR family transcriptional regulator